MEERVISQNRGTERKNLLGYVVLFLLMYSVVRFAVRQRPPIYSNIFRRTMTTGSLFHHGPLGLLIGCVLFVVVVLVVFQLLRTMNGRPDNRGIALLLVAFPLVILPN